MSRPRVALLALLALVFALYAPSLRNGFTYDDPYVARAERAPGVPNPLIAGLQPLGRYFRATYWQGQIDVRPEYRPLTILSFALVHRAFGPELEAFGQHLVNVLLHVAATALVYLLLCRLSVSPAAAWVGAAVFGANAVHSEAVAAVVGRSELLAFAGGATATLLVERGARGALGASLGWFVAFAAKESALAWIPFAGLTLALRGRLRWTAALAALAPAALFLALRQSVVSELPEGAPIATFESNPLASLDAGTRVLNALALQVYGLYKMAFPFHLASDYGHAVFDLVESPADPRFLLAVALLLGAAVLALRSWRRRPLVLLAIAAWLGFAFPTSNLALPIGTIFGERLLYAPSLSLSLLAAWAWTASCRAPRRRQALAAALLVWGAACGIVIQQRNAAWRSDAALFTTDAEAQPRSIRLHILASDVDRARGDVAGQFEHLEKAFSLKPDPAHAWLRVAWFFEAEGRLAEAERALRSGLRASREGAERYGALLHWTRARVLRARDRIAASEAQRRRARVAWRRLDAPALERLAEDLRLERAQAARVWREFGDYFAKRGTGEDARRARTLAREYAASAPSAP